MKLFAIALLCTAIFSGCALNDSSKPLLVRAPDYKKASQINAELGMKYLSRNDFQNARIKFDSAIEQDANNVEANHGFALLADKTGQFDLAEKHLKKAIRLSSNDPRIVNTYGIFLCERQRYPEAYRTFISAAENPIYNTPEYAYDNAGYCALNSRDLSQSQDFLIKALETNDAFAPANLHMAELLYQQKRPNLALDYIKSYHKLADQTSVTLWLAFRIAKAAKIKNDQQIFAVLLTEKFPHSAEAKRYKELEQ